MQQLQKIAVEERICYSLEDGLYVGGFLNGLKHGRGRLLDKDGNLYEGQFEGGQKHGQGRIVFANGDLYGLK